MQVKKEKMKEKIYESLTKMKIVQSIYLDLNLLLLWAYL